MKKILSHLILLTGRDIDFSDRLNYLVNLVLKLTPIVFLLNLINWWFSENQQFGTFLCIALLLNMIVGAVYHWKNGSFSFPQFLGQNALMIFTISSVYIMLEMLRYTAGDNLIGDLFRITIQITTLMYPTSKIFKNCFILSNGKYPPEFIMQRLYKFEKSGDLSDFFNKTKKQDA